MKLQHGHVYAADISLSWGEKLVATNSMIQGKLEDAGFTNVTVTGDGSTRHAQGTWNGGDEDVSLPSQIVESSIQDLTAAAPSMPTAPQPRPQMLMPSGFEMNFWEVGLLAVLVGGLYLLSEHGPSGHLKASEA